MSERRVKQWRRQVRKESGRIVTMAVEQARHEPLEKRIRVAWFMLRGESSGLMLAYVCLSLLFSLLGVVFVAAMLLAPYVEPDATFQENLQHILHFAV